MKYQNNFWKQYFKYYDFLLKVIPYQELFKSIVNHVAWKPNLKILDLGAGTGNLQHFLPKNTGIVSLDNSDEALKRLKIKFPDSKVVKHSIQDKLPFDDNTFDRVVSNNVLYTLQKEEWDFVVSEIARISKPKSIIVISNLNDNFKPMNIYLDHVKKSIRRNGWFNSGLELSKLIYPTIKIMQFNKTIKSNNDAGRYSFLKPNEQKEKFEKFGLESIADTEIVYSGQAFLNVFENGKLK